MKRPLLNGGALLLSILIPAAHAESASPKPPAELRKLDAWVGSWTLSGTAQDGPDQHPYPVLWVLQEHWVLNGAFLQVEQTWNGNGQTQHYMEMLSYEANRNIYTDVGFGSDGSTWSLTATFNGATMVESGETKGPDGSTTRCKMTWVFRNHGASLSGTQRCDRNGASWIALAVAGNKARVSRSNR